MSAAATTTTTPVAFTPQQTQKWELGVALILHFWPVLADAVACGWGGANSGEKREWLCGNVADMWAAEDAETDDYDVEARLVQVMEDEFDVNLEDDSAFEVSSRPWRVQGRSDGR